MVRVSIVVAAFDAADSLPYCLDSVARSAQTVVGGDVACEVVVAAHGCADATLALGRLMEATVVPGREGTLAATRNAAAQHAAGDVLVFVDGDCLLPICAVSDIVGHLDDPTCVGGGAGFVPERRSLGAGLAVGVRRLGMAVTGLGGVLHWCRRADFEAVEGFNDALAVGEQADFGRRLREHGRHSARRYVNLLDTPVVVGSQRFERYGDWHLLGSLTRRSSRLLASAGS